MSFPSHAVVRRKLPWWGVAGRFLLACFLVFATYNPSYYSLATLIVSDVSNPSARLFLGFCLLLAWIIILRVSLAGLDRLAWYAVLSFIVILGLLEIEFQLFRTLNSFTAILLLELLVAGILAFGLIQSYWVRSIAGQSPVVKHPP